MTDETQLDDTLDVHADEWRNELPLIEEWFAKFGDKLPEELKAQLETLKKNIESVKATV